jgi:Flp pilus assembly protein TadD
LWFSLCVLVSGCSSNRNRTLPSLTTAEGVRLERIGAWAFSPGGTYFATGSGDGGIRLWETLKGRQLFFFQNDNYAGVSSLAFASGMKSLVISAAGNEYSLDLSSLDLHDSAYQEPGFSLIAAKDGSLVLRDENSGTELFRYYCFSGEGGPWLCMGRGACYDTGGEGIAADNFLLLKAWGKERPLACFAELLFRPGLLAAAGPSAIPDSLLEKQHEPPRLRYKGEVLVSPDGQEAEVTVTVSGQKGGEALAVLYRRDRRGREFPITLFPLRPEKDTRSYDAVVRLPLEPGENHIGLSVFNQEHTVESGRLWFSCYAKEAPGLPAAPGKPVLHVVSASGENTGFREELETFLSRQERGELYSAVKIHTGLAGLSGTVFPAGDILLFFLELGGPADFGGDFSFAQADGKSDGAGSKLAFLRTLPRLDSEKNIFIFNFERREGSAVSSAAGLEAAFQRLVRWLGPAPVLLSEASGQAGAAFFAVVNGSVEPYLTVSGVFGGMEQALAGRLLFSSLPGGPLSGDFRIIDRYAGQEMSPSVPARPGGSVPSLFSGLQSLRSGSGVNFAELDPANYQDFNPGVLAAMGVERYMILYLSGQNLYRNKQYDRAIEEYTKSIGLNASFAGVYAARGNAHNRKGNFGPAIEDYTRALRIEPNSAEVYNYRGFAYAAGGEFTRAVEDYSRAIGGRSGYADAYYNRARAYESLGEYRSAIGDYSRLIELEPRNASAYNRRGCVFYDLLDDDLAIRDFSEAIRLSPDNAVYYRNRGNAWSGKGDYERARADLNQARKLDPRYAPDLSPP